MLGFGFSSKSLSAVIQVWLLGRNYSDLSIRLGKSLQVCLHY